MSLEIKPKRKQQDYIITPAKVLSDTEAYSLNALCTRYLDIPREARNALIILVSSDGGLRANETLNIEVGDVDFTNCTIYIRTLKGGRPRVLPYRKSLIDKIKKHVMENNPECSSPSQVPQDQKVFAISYSRLEQIWRMMRPNPTKKFQSLRHTFAIRLYLRTRDIKLVQMALGHKRIENTMVYVDFIYANTSMRKALVVGE